MTLTEKQKGFMQTFCKTIYRTGDNFDLSLSYDGEDVLTVEVQEEYWDGKEILTRTHCIEFRPVAVSVNP